MQNVLVVVFMSCLSPVFSSFTHWCYRVDLTGYRASSHNSETGMSSLKCDHFCRSENSLTYIFEWEVLKIHFIYQISVYKSILKKRNKGCLFCRCRISEWAGQTTNIWQETETAMHVHVIYRSTQTKGSWSPTQNTAVIPSQQIVCIYVGYSIPPRLVIACFFLR